MTESQWFSCTNPHEMLAFLKETKATGLGSVLCWFGIRKSNVNRRKLRLFACACCRRLWPLLADDRSRRAIEVSELYAEGEVGKKALQDGAHAAKAASLQPRITLAGWAGAIQARAAEAVACTLESDDPADEAATWGKEVMRAWANSGTNPKHAINLPRPPHPTMSPEAAWIAEGIAQCNLIRDMIGNPFSHQVLDASRRPSHAVTLASTIYQDHAFSNLPELANILEQAGCKNSEILQHCREKKEHARGCWALDLVLGKG
jgi:hypothetical protein